MKPNSTTVGANAPQHQKTARRTVLGIALNVLLLIVMLTIAAAITTQYLAHQFQYAPQLGQPLHGAWYFPWDWVQWAWYYRRHYTGVIDTGLLVFMVTMGIALVIYGFTRVLIRRSSKGLDNLHGSARWAMLSDIQDSGLLPKGDQEATGVYCGAWKDPAGQTHYLRHDGPEHLLTFAPTRSGKGVGLVLPTLLSWLGSCIVFDIKGENYALTAGWRKDHANNRILKFDPTDPEHCACYNPLAEIRLGEKRSEVKDTQNIAQMLVDDEGKGISGNHWLTQAQALLTAVILHTCYIKDADGQTASLGDVDFTLTDPSKNIGQVLNAMLEYPHTESGPHPLIAQTARQMLNTPEKELGSIVSTAVSKLTLYRDPVVRANVSESHWKIKDLMQHEQSVSLYLVVPPSDRDRLLPLLRLMLTQITKKLTESMEFEGGRSKAHYEHRLLMMLDEFASLKKMAAIEDALSFAAGYGIKFYLIIQDVDQITAHDMYGRENGIMGNCHVRIAYAPNNQPTAELLSKMAGTTTVVKESITESGKRHSWVLASTSRSYSEHQRPLITPDEVSRLPKPVTNNQGKITEPGHMLVFVAGSPPIYGVQILYFLDPVFMARAKYASDHTPGSDQIRGADKDTTTAVSVELPSPEETASTEVEKINTPSREDDNHASLLTEADQDQSL